jgi:hypothetical protein
VQRQEPVRVPELVPELVQLQPPVPALVLQPVQAAHQQL